MRQPNLNLLKMVDPKYQKVLTQQPKIVWLFRAHLQRNVKQTPMKMKNITGIHENSYGPKQ